MQATIRLHPRPGRAEEVMMTITTVLTPDITAPRLGPRSSFAASRPWSWLALVAALVWQIGWALVNLIQSPFPLSAMWVVWKVHDALLLVTLAFAGLALVANSRRRLWMAPIVLAVFGSWAISWAQALLGSNPIPTGELLAIGWEDLLDGAVLGSQISGTTLFEVAVLAAPAIALLRATLPSETLRLDGYAPVALGFSLALVAMLGYLWEVLAPYEGAWLNDAQTYLLLVLVGAGVGTRRGWWPWLHLTLGLFAGAGLQNLVGAIEHGTGVGTHVVREAILLATPLLAAAWEPLAAWFARTSARSPLIPLVLLNGLNVADAALTEAAISAGRAQELNPVVRYLGSPIKIVLVGVASLLLYRHRPRTLWWPTTALLAVLAWHVMGVALGT